jgi:hypothetical protein
MKIENQQVNFERYASASDMPSEDDTFKIFL